MKKSFFNKINTEIKEIESLLKESVNFCEDESMDSIESTEYDDEVSDDMEYDESELDNTTLKTDKNIDSYIDNIRKYSLNGLSALCNNPESEQYQKLKKIFQMCDKKPEKRDNMMESHRIFGVLKGNNEVLFEMDVKNKENFNELKKDIIKESIKRGYNPSNIRLVSENKIIKN
jgi:transcriptional regulator of heat shock response